MKSKDDFLDIDDYWEYTHTTCTLHTISVLLQKEHWKDYSQVAKEAIKVADEVIKQLKKRKM